MSGSDGQGLVITDNLQGGLIVNVNLRQSSLWKSHLLQDKPWMLCSFCSSEAAMNSASVELDAVIVWVLLSHAIAPPETVNAHPAIDLCFLSCEP